MSFVRVFYISCMHGLLSFGHFCSVALCIKYIIQHLHIHDNRKSHGIEHAQPCCHVIYHCVWHDCMVVVI